MILYHINTVHVFVSGWYMRTRRIRTRYLLVLRKRKACISNLMYLICSYEMKENVTIKNVY